MKRPVSTPQPQQPQMAAVARPYTDTFAGFFGLECHQGGCTR